VCIYIHITGNRVWPAMHFFVFCQWQCYIFQLLLLLCVSLYYYIYMLAYDRVWPAMQSRIVRYYICVLIHYICVLIHYICVLTQGTGCGLQCRPAMPTPIALVLCVSSCYYYMCVLILLHIRQQGVASDAVANSSSSPQRNHEQSQEVGRQKKKST
jgi:hypothetical protein